VNKPASSDLSNPLYPLYTGKLFAKLFFYIIPGKVTSQKKMIPGLKQKMQSYSGNYTGMITTS